MSHSSSMLHDAECDDCTGDAAERAGCPIPSTLHVYYAEPDTFVAESLKEATAMAVTHGHHPGDLERNEYPEELPDDKLIGIFCDDSGAISDSGNVVKQTAAEWAASNGKGLLCTEEL